MIKPCRIIVQNILKINIFLKQDILKTFGESLKFTTKNNKNEDIN